MNVEKALTSAKSHAKRGDFVEAETLYRSVLAKFPKNNRALQGLAGLRAAGVAITPVGQPPQSEINALIALYRQGQLQQVLTGADRLLQHYPNALILHNISGAAKAGLQDYPAAIASFERALQIKPDQAETYNNLANVQQLQGDLAAALASYRQALLIQPDYAEAHNNLGMALRQQGDLGAAVASCRAAIAARPDYAEAHNNLGVVLLEQGLPAEAAASLRAALALAPKYTDALYNLGNALRDGGDLAAAADKYRETVAIAAGYADAHYNLGDVLRAQGKTDPAIAAYKLAIKASPDHAEAHNNLALAYQDKGDVASATASFQAALGARADYAAAFANLCELFEKNNDLSGLQALLADPAHSGFLADANVAYFRAALAFRQKDYTNCAAILASIDPNALHPSRITLFYNLLGRNHDKADQPDLAFAAFGQMNRATRDLRGFADLGAEGYFQDRRRFLAQIRAASPKAADQQAENGALAFLVGFPRSGTTLMDTILRSHSQITVVEEKPLIAGLMAEIGNQADLEQIEALDSPTISRLRDRYHAELINEGAGQAGRITIDKFPLNALNAPLIHRVFPEARFILALRHPFDAILSCFMQNFAPNPAMANMTELARIVAFYDVTMATWKLSAARYGLQVHPIRYEDLVLDMPGEMTRLLSFLDLEWQAGLSAYQTTARSRGLIKTPSYSQVVEPLYTDASYRWKKYASYFAPFRDKIDPWIAEFGY